MQTTIRKTTESKGKSKEKSSKDDISVSTKKAQEEKPKRSVYSVSTPRNFVQKSTTADIYAQKKKISAPATKTPKKVPGTTNLSNASPMKNLLKSSASSVSQISQISSKIKNSTPTNNEAKASTARHATPRTARDLPFVNVTVNSPVARRKINQDGGKKDTKIGGKTEEISKRISKVNPKDGEERQRAKGEVTKNISKTDSKDGEERQRTKTRTLNENEVKVLTPEGVDNNAEMLNLARKLAAKPKAFYVELDEPKNKPQNDKTSEDEVSYEDDFESYESDFESYHESSEHSENSSNEHTMDDIDEREDRTFDETNSRAEDVSKDVKDEEKMLDSGNFDLRDARSANKSKPMQFILEDGEPDVRSSLTDEGFQEMSSSGSSIRTVHTDVLDRPLFIDFTKSKADKRKRKIFERLKQRAKDILSMVTLHEMSYSLFEMKPIPYDLYIATFGRSNYTQSAVQTFDDGITEETQTEEIPVEDKWTQHPVDFSKHDIHLKTHKKCRKNSNNIEDYLTKFTFLINNKTDVEINNQINVDVDYKSNPLRVYFEQKNGAGSSEMLPYEAYKTKLKTTDFNTLRLGKFLKKCESRLSHILSKNIGSDATDLIKTSKYPFSKGYVVISTNNITNEDIQFIKQAKINGVVVSETRNNLILTIHDKYPNVIENKYFLCLWDVSVAIRDPVKIIISIDSIRIARFRGGTDGILVAALNDGSLHLWDLSEEPTWYPNVDEEKPKDLEKSDGLTPTEKDREWNASNSHIGLNSLSPRCILQACDYTTSASAMKSGPSALVTGLVVETGAVQTQDGGRRVLGQVFALQRIGIITIWSIIQEKLKNSSTDMGKAYWSKMKLEKKQVISLVEHIGLPNSDSMENIFESTFSLTAAKRRTSARKKEKSMFRQLSRPKSAASFDSDRPSSAAIAKNNKMLPAYSWEDGIVCNDLKLMRLKNNDNYLVAKNCGEVLCCTKNLGVVKINRFCVATSVQGSAAPTPQQTPTSSRHDSRLFDVTIEEQQTPTSSQSADLSAVTCIEVSPHSLPYFLAATDAGTVNLCSLLEYRVLLTLDCRNGPSSPDLERYQVDSKGRFLGSARPATDPSLEQLVPGMAVKSVFWWRNNPCCIVALQESGSLLTWELARSDIRAVAVTTHAANVATAGDNTLALVSCEGEVQAHSLPEQRGEQYLQLFQKYAALL